MDPLPCLTTYRQLDVAIDLMKPTPLSGSMVAGGVIFFSG